MSKISSFVIGNAGARLVGRRVKRADPLLIAVLRSASPPLHINPLLGTLVSPPWIASPSWPFASLRSAPLRSVASEIRTSEVSVAKVRIVKLCAAKFRAAKNRTIEERASEVCVSEIRVGKVWPLKFAPVKCAVSIGANPFRPLERCLTEVRIYKLRAAEVSVAEIRMAEFRGDAIFILYRTIFKAVRIDTRVGQIGKLKVRVGEVRADNKRASEARMGEIGIGEVNAGEVRISQVSIG